MSVFNSLPPKINKIHLNQWLIDNYSFLNKKKISLKSFNSERDKNFLMQIEEKSKYVLKISNSKEMIGLLELQDYVLCELNKRPSLRGLIPKKIHSSIKIYTDSDNRKCYVRILSYIKGKMYASIKQNSNLEKSLGLLLGNLSSELKNIMKPEALRKFEWDPSDIKWIGNFFYMFSGDKKKIIIKNLEEHNYFVTKNLNKLRFSLTHGDANNYNLVVNKNQISGLLDYGDMIYAPTINDLSISLSYALMSSENIHLTLKNVIVSYHSIFNITFDEIFSLMTLVKSRLTITVVMAEKQRKKFPNNEYLSISEKDAWKLLYKLDSINPYFFIFLIRYFCEYPISKNYEKIIAFLKVKSFSSILDCEINNLNKSIIKLSEKPFSTKKYLQNHNILNRKINSYLKLNDSDIGIGLYKEKRQILKVHNYNSQLISGKKKDMHLGIDIYAKAGTNIRSPLNGKVFTLNKNSAEHECRTKLILEHKINQYIKFYTIYGNLSKKSLVSLKIDQNIKKGNIIGQIGNSNTKSALPEHLHFQISIDMMSDQLNFPAVSERSLLDFWSKISPDPNLILEIPNSFFENNENLKSLLLKRQSLISKNFSISYEKPLHMLEAKNQFFYDDKGRKFLDCVNNISHVGHSHPKIHEAMVNQNLKLNTNTRYL